MKSIGKKLAVLMVLMLVMADPRQLNNAIQAQRTPGRLERASEWIKGQVSDIFSNSSGVGSAILGGIMLMIVGFATLVLGNYIIYAIATSLPALDSSDYNSTYTSIMGYATTVIPLFGLALMVLGFAIILYVLRSSQNQQ